MPIIRSPVVNHVAFLWSGPMVTTPQAIDPDWTSNVDPPPVHDYLSAYVRRRRRWAAVRATGWAVAVFVTAALLACLADRPLGLPVPARAALLAVAIVGTTATLARPVARLTRRQFDTAAAAAAVEHRHPAFGHQLVAAASADGSADLRAELDRTTAAVIAAVGPPAVPRRPAAVAWAAAAVALAAATGLWRWPWLDLPDLAERFVRPTAGVPAVTAVRLVVRPGPDRVIEGQPLTVTADVSRLPASDVVTLHVSGDGQTWAERPMAPAGGAYAATVPAVDGDLRSFVTAGDATSPTVAVRVVRVPAVVAFRVRCDPPGSTVTASDGRVDAPAGSTVTLDVVATVPLRDATVTVGPDRVATSATADPAVRRARFKAAEGSLAVDLIGTDDTVGRGPAGARVRVMGPDADVAGFEDQQRAYRAATRPARP